MDHCATWLEPTALLLLERRYGNPVINSVLVLLQYTSRFYLCSEEDLALFDWSLTASEMATLDKQQL